MSNFDQNLQLEINHSLGDDSHDTKNMAKRRFMAWYTDLVFMGNVNMVAISSSGRDIKFYDVVAQGFVEIFHLYGKVRKELKITSSKIV